MAINQHDKGSNNNGPNAYKKGNRTKGRPELVKAGERFSKQKSEDIGKYREQAEKYRKNRKYTQEQLTDIYSRVLGYMEQCKEVEKPMTVSGTILAANLPKSTWYEMINGDYDYKLFEYIDLHSIDIDKDSYDFNGMPCIRDDESRVVLLIPYSEVLKKAMLAIEAQTEERLYEKGRIGDIFGLKAIHGWQEDATPQTVNNTLVIASPEQAQEAIRMLK